MAQLVSGNHGDLQEILERVYERDTFLARTKGRHLSLFAHGTFGIGKSDAIVQFAKRMAEKLGLVMSENPNDINDEKKFMVIKLPLHQMDVSEIKGIPFTNEDRTSTVFLPLGLLPKKGQGIIFLDEFNLAAPMVQSNAYQLILERKLGFYQIPDGFTVVAAGNMLDDNGHTFDMAVPLKNRFIHFQLRMPTYDEWMKSWAVKAGIDHRIISYLAFQQDALYRYDVNMAEDLFSIPSPRTWVMASDMIDGITDQELLEKYVGAAVGAAMGMEFVSWLNLSKSYDIDGIYKGKDFEVPAEDEVDQTYSLISALIGFYLNKLKESKGSKKKAKDGKDDMAQYANRLVECSFKFQREHTIMALALVSRQDDEFVMRVDDKLFNQVSEDIFKML